MIEFKVDPERKDDGDGVTGIYIRATLDGKYGSYDIATLTGESLMAFLRSRGGKNEWAENCVLTMLGHKQNAQDYSEPLQTDLEPKLCPWCHQRSGHMPGCTGAEKSNQDTCT